MAQDPTAPTTPPPRFEPGQTVIFLGDHTSPDNPGYVRVVKEIVGRFYPELGVNFISAGAEAQTSRGLRSRALMDILLSSKPDWLVLNIGLGDALREPETSRLYDIYRIRRAAAEEESQLALGPEYRVNPLDLGPQSDVGKEPEPQLERLEDFRANLGEAIMELQAGGVRPVLFTTVVLGSDLSNPINATLRAYSRAIREIASSQRTPLVDIERAFRDVLDRATNYKQTVSLTVLEGKVNAQGEALIARNFLGTFGLLPGAGFRPRK